MLEAANDNAAACYGAAFVQFELCVRGGDLTPPGHLVYLAPDALRALTQHGAPPGCTAIRSDTDHRLFVRGTPATVIATVLAGMRRLRECLEGR